MRWGWSWAKKKRSQIFVCYWGKKLACNLTDRPCSILVSRWGEWSAQFWGEMEKHLDWKRGLQGGLWEMKMLRSILWWDVGIKLRLDDLGSKEWRSCETSVGVTEETREEQIESVSGGCRWSLSILDFMAVSRLLIFKIKKWGQKQNCGRVILCYYFLSYCWENLDVWRRLLTVFQHCLVLEHELTAYAKCFFLDSLFRKFTGRQDAL